MAKFLDRSDFNIGQDINLTVISSTGQRWTSEELGILVDCECDFEDHEVSVKAMNFKGLPKFVSIPAGTTGKVMFARFDGTLSKLLAKKQSDFYQSGILTNFSLQFQIRNRDGSFDTYLLKSASISKGKLFSGKADKEIDQGFNFRASELVITQ